MFLKLVNIGVIFVSRSSVCFSLSNSLYMNAFVGGAGGGIIHLNVSDILHVEGRVSSNGESAPNLGYGGGGSGGSVLINTRILEGSGTLEV